MSARDMAAMRSAVEKAQGFARITAGLPPETRRTFAISDEAVGLAVEIAKQGGRTMSRTMPGEPGFELAGWALLEFFPRTGWTLRDDVMADYLARVVDNGKGQR